MVALYERAFDLPSPFLKMILRDSTLTIEMAESIGCRVSSIREIVGRGEVNHGFVVDTSHGLWVVRFAIDPRDLDDYAKEAWCLQSAGVPTPELIAVGNLRGVPFIVQSFVDGATGDDRRSPDLWRALGRYSRLINDVPIDQTAPDSLFSRFGRDPAANWRAHIAYNLEVLTPDDPLIRLGVYEPSRQGRLRDAFERLEGKVDRFGLTHGDLVPKNVLVPEGRAPVVIDWGSASTGPVPYHDFLRMWADEADEGFLPDDLAHFAEGYGIPFETIRATMEDIGFLNRIDLVRWAIDRRPDRLDEVAAKAKRAIAERFG